MTKPVSRRARASRIIAPLLIAMALAGPLPAKTDAGQTSLDEDMQVAQISHRLAVANADWCPQTQPLTGMILHDIAAYDAATRAAVDSRFGLGRDLGVRGVVAGSAADRAGLRRDDVIVAVGGVPVATLETRLIGDKASFARTQWLQAWLTMRLQAGAQAITVHRRGEVLTLTLTAQPGCAGTATVEPGQRFDAWSDGHNIAVSHGVLAGISQPDGLAFVLAHEMGHNWLDQAKLAPSTISAGLRTILAMPVGQESRADLIAIAAMRRAGYDPHAASALLDQLAKTMHSSSRGWSLKQRKHVLDEAILDQATPGTP